MSRLWPDGIPVEVRSGSAAPMSFLWQGTAYEVVEVCNRWRVHTCWWAPSQATRREYGGIVWREYIKVLTNDGTLCLLYQDQINGEWFLARVYD
jgi:hypothetical protein